MHKGTIPLHAIDCRKVGPISTTKTTRKESGARMNTRIPFCRDISYRGRVITDHDATWGFGLARIGLVVGNMNGWA